MNFVETKNFIENINKYREQEIISYMPYIKNYLFGVHWHFAKTSFENLLSVIDKDKLLFELFKDEEKFSYWTKILDFPENLKFGVEIEVAQLPIEIIKYLFESGSIITIMRTLGIPTDILNKIIQNSDFEKKDEFNKWIFSRETFEDVSEASSPIMKNNLCDLNQIVAICTLFKVLNAETHGGTALHINVGDDYFGCNEKAIENLLRIWGECEELFFKIANPEGEVMRVAAQNMAAPIKENIEDFFENDGNILLNTEEDIERFLYQIQARNRLRYIVEWVNLGPNYRLLDDLSLARNDEERFQVYRTFNKGIKEKGITESRVRWTSINFNHMKWDPNNPGRIEIRIFNSSLEPKIIFEDLLLVGKIFEVCLKNAKNPNYKKREFEQLLLCNVTELTKLNNLLNLLFDDDEQKRIFRNRWQSVRDKTNKYEIYKSGKDTFKSYKRTRKI